MGAFGLSKQCLGAALGSHVGLLWDPKGDLGMPWGALGDPKRANVAVAPARMRFLGG